MMGFMTPTRPKQPGRGISGHGQSWSQQKRPLIPVGKMFSMPNGRALVWLPGDEAPHVSRINRLADANPYFRG